MSFGGEKRRQVARRTHARQAVRRAGLPLLRTIVDRARAMLDELDGVRERVDITADALRREYASSAPPKRTGRAG